MWIYFFNFVFLLGFVILFIVYFVLNYFFLLVGVGEIDMLDDFGIFILEEVMKIGIDNYIEGKDVGVEINMRKFLVVEIIVMKV